MAAHFHRRRKLQNAAWSEGFGVALPVFPASRWFTSTPKLGQVRILDCEARERVTEAFRDTFQQQVVNKNLDLEASFTSLLFV